MGEVEDKTASNICQRTWKSFSFSQETVLNKVGDYDQRTVLFPPFLFTQKVSLFFNLLSLLPPKKT